MIAEYLDLLRCIFEACIGKVLWKWEKTVNKISSDDIVIILPEENEVWNNALLKLLPQYVDRTNANKVLIYYNPVFEITNNEEHKGLSIILKEYEPSKMKMIYRYFCLNGFRDYMIWGYLKYPIYNCGEKILSYGEITVEELACLGYYCLRGIYEPERHYLQCTLKRSKNY